MKKNMYEVTYECEGQEYVNSSDVMDVILAQDNDHVRLVLKPKKKVTLLKADICLPGKMSLNGRFLSNGYQSWTDTEELNLLQRNKKMGLLGHIKKLEAKYCFSKYGDYSFIKYHRHYSFSFTYLKKKDDVTLFGSLDERAGYTVFYLKGRKLRAYKDCKGLAVETDTDLFNIAITYGDRFDAFRKYALGFKKTLMPKGGIKGFTTWYRHYNDIDEKKIDSDLEAVTKSGIDFNVFQIDDGYEKEVGDWLTPDKVKFPSGLKPIVGKIKEKNLTPGIWLAPFLCGINSNVYKEHPSWVLTDKDDKPIRQSHAWGGAYVLDFYNPEVRKHLHEVFKGMIDEGFELFKLDFLYAVCLRIPEGKTRGGVMIEAMEFLREELKGKKILACGVPLFPAFFNCDYCRIGPDISLKWDDLWYMKFAHRERISSKITIKNTYYRSPLDGLFFACDPDVILLKGTEMSEKQKEKIFSIDKEFGSVYLTSDDISLYNEDDKKKWMSL